jgi:hypothetical protein
MSAACLNRIGVLPTITPEGPKPAPHLTQPRGKPQKSGCPTNNSTTAAEPDPENAEPPASTAMALNRINGADELFVGG